MGGAAKTGDARSARDAVGSERLDRDPLTGLLTRQRFLGLSTLREATAEFAGILILSIFRFGRINEIWGTDVGDLCLIDMADWLRSNSADNDVLARLSSNQFAVAFTVQSPVVVAVAGAGARKVRLAGHEIAMSMCGGWAARVPRQPLSELLGQAQTAIETAQQHLWPVLMQWDPAIAAAQMNEIEDEEIVRQAIESRHLTVSFQPIFDVRTGQLDSMEALARLHEPRKDLPAQRIVDVSRRLGLAAQFATVIFDRAFADGAQLQASMPSVKIAVNVARELLGNFRTIDLIAEVATRAGVALSDVVIELTEDGAHGVPPARLCEAAGHAIELGMQVVIDDFGTGETSLSLIRTLRASAIKLDRSLVPPAEDDPGWAFLGGVVAMLHAVTPRLVAEGVETAQQSQRLATLGVFLQQGYLLGHPHNYRHWMGKSVVLP